MNQGVKAVRSCCGAMSQKIGRRKFGTQKREIGEFLASDYGEPLLLEFVNQNQEEIEKKLGGKVGAFGDGKILQAWLDWLGSDGFKKFAETFVPFMEAIIKIIMTIAI